MPLVSERVVSERITDTPADTLADTTAGKFAEIFRRITRVLRAGVPALLLPLLLVTTSLASMPAAADDKSSRSVLDKPLTQNTAGLGKQELRRVQREQRRQARREAKELRRMDRHELRKAAREGNRLAQLVVADNLVQEARQWAEVPLVANDALSEAAYWYSIAARRGYPGARPVDAVLPAMPMRVFR